MSSSGTSTLPLIVEGIGFLAVPFSTWLFNRISKARQLETHVAIKDATEKSKNELTEHTDQRLQDLTEHTDARFDELRGDVLRVDSDQKNTALDLAHLRGRFDQSQNPRGM